VKAAKVVPIRKLCKRGPRYGKRDPSIGKSEKYNKFKCHPWEENWIGSIKLKIIYIQLDLSIA